MGVDRSGREMVVLGVGHVEVLGRGIIGGAIGRRSWNSIERWVAVGLEDGEGVGVGVGEVGGDENSVKGIVGIGVNDDVGRWKEGLDGPEVEAVSRGTCQKIAGDSDVVEIAQEDGVGCTDVSRSIF